ncbi:MAG: hypothetical protein O7G30_17280 [Proteobacteria bacterium]|nr:hypothetical protein [Pseudomonadota bacterium]
MRVFQWTALLAAFALTTAGLACSGGDRSVDAGPVTDAVAEVEGIAIATDDGAIVAEDIVVETTDEEEATE